MPAFMRRLYRADAINLAFLCRFAHVPDISLLGAVMNMYRRDEGIALVAKRLRETRKSLPPCEQTTHLEMLIDACAWTDAMIALMEQELPDWTPRRPIFEDGAWHCSLSRTPFLPLDFDDTADGSGSCPALAMLRAVSEARRRPQMPTEPGVDPCTQFLCENFA
jgi:hypothetical protein